MLCCTNCVSGRGVGLCTRDDELPSLVAAKHVAVLVLPLLRPTNRASNSIGAQCNCKGQQSALAACCSLVKRAARLRLARPALVAAAADVLQLPPQPHQRRAAGARLAGGTHHGSRQAIDSAQADTLCQGARCAQAAGGWAAMPGLQPAGIMLQQLLTQGESRRCTVYT